MLSPERIEVIKEQAYVGVPSSFYNICTIRPLTIREIVEMGTDTYNFRLGLLLLTEIEISEMLNKRIGQDIPIEQIHPLEYLLKNADYNDDFLLDLQKCFSTFIQEDILLLPKINAVLVGDPQKKKLITNDNFSDFQDILRIQNQREVKEAPPKNESEIARKFRLKREARDAAKRKQMAKKGEGQTMLDMFEIAETFGIDYQNKTLFAFYNLLRRHQLKDKWDHDMMMVCAGADSKKLKMQYWGESSSKL